LANKYTSQEEMRWGGGKEKRRIVERKGYFVSGLIFLFSSIQNNFIQISLHLPLLSCDYFRFEVT